MKKNKKTKNPHSETSPSQLSRVFQLQMNKLFTILFISLLMFSCDSDDNPVSSSSEIDVDWVLIKMNQSSGIGHYYFYHVGGFSPSNQINVENFNFNDGNISFIYNGENFNYDISDSDFGSDCGLGSNYCFITNSEEGEQSFTRIMYNQEMNYVTCVCTFNSVCNDMVISTLSPFELVDYR